MFGHSETGYAQTSLNRKKHRVSERLWSLNSFMGTFNVLCLELEIDILEATNSKERELFFSFSLKHRSLAILSTM